MSQSIIEVSHVYKKFKAYMDKSAYLKDKLIFHNINKFEERWVLKDISFEIKPGEALGIIGQNGCGKSTMLKLLSRIIYPDKGNIKIKGCVSSLLELGAGFHMDMSGRENIYMNAAVFGLTRREIDKRIDDIIEFSELADFIENPVRTYSSGMYMKLAFSVAINVDADILLIDEILAVGDVNFQKKCFEKLKEIKDNGATIVIVSHSLNQIEQICDRSIWIDNGCVRDDGSPLQVHASYLETMQIKRDLQIQEQEEKRQRKQQELLKLQKLSQKERIEQENYLRKVEEERKRQEALQKKKIQKQLIGETITISFSDEVEQLLSQGKLKDPLEKDRKMKFYARESDRLGNVIKEKDKEINRLEVSVKEIALEVDRLNSVAREKDYDNNRLNSIIREKDCEISRLNGIIEDKDNEIQDLINAINGIQRET